MKPCRFYVDGDPSTLFEGVSLETRWNGWDVVAMLPGPGFLRFMELFKDALDNGWEGPPTSLFNGLHVLDGFCTVLENPVADVLRNSLPAGPETVPPMPPGFIDP